MMPYSTIKFIGKVALCLGLTIVVSTAVDTWTLKIDNQSDITDPWVVFTDAPNVTYVTEVKGKATTIKVVNNTGIKLSAVKDASFTVTTIADVMFISDKELDLSNGNPNPTNDDDPNNDARWQPVEFKSDGATMYCDVTYVNYYCIPVAFGEHGKASAAKLDALRTKLSSYGAVQNHIILSPANGNPGVPGQKGIVRPLEKFPSLKNYVTAAFGKKADSIMIKGEYNGDATKSGKHFEKQSYSTSKITYDGTTLTVVGKGGIVKPFTLTATKTPAELSEAIYKALLDYTKPGGAGNNGDNDVYSVVIRDLLAGFALGFVNSKDYGSLTSDQWWKQTKAFGAVQTTAANYNVWASDIYHTFGNTVYGFQYNDLWMGGESLITYPSGSTITLAIQKESAAK